MNDFHDYLLTCLRIDFSGRTFEIELRQLVDGAVSDTAPVSTIRGRGLQSFSSTVEVDELINHARSGTVSWVKDVKERKKLVIFLVSGTLEISYDDYEIILNEP